MEKIVACGRPCCICQMRCTYCVSERLGSSARAGRGAKSRLQITAQKPTERHICFHLLANGRARRYAERQIEHLAVWQSRRRQPDPILGRSTSRKPMDSKTPSALDPGRPPVLPGVRDETRRSSSRGWIWLVVLAVLSIGGYCAWRGVKPMLSARAPAAGGHARNRAMGPIPVVAAKVHRGNIGVYLTGLGAVTPLYTVTVKSRVDGQLMSVRYNEGQIVRQGDLLVEIDP